MGEWVKVELLIKIEMGGWVVVKMGWDWVEWMDGWLRWVGIGWNGWMGG